MIEKLPSLCRLGHPTQRALVDWILHRSRLRRPLVLTSLMAMENDLKINLGASVLPENLIPCYVFACADNEGTLARQGNLTHAFHGTSFECLHSILAHGLLNLGQHGDLMQTGQVFGEGIYASRHYETAFGFSRPTTIGWPNSCLGRSMRAMLVLQVPEEAIRTEDGQGMDAVNDAYIIVQGSSVVQLRYVLLFIDEPPTLTYDEALAQSRSEKERENDTARQRTTDNPTERSSLWRTVGSATLVLLLALIIDRYRVI